jgi:hypothetical protein
MTFVFFMLRLWCFAAPVDPRHAGAPNPRGWRANANCYWPQHALPPPSIPQVAVSLRFVVVVGIGMHVPLEREWTHARMRACCLIPHRRVVGVRDVRQATHRSAHPFFLPAVTGGSRAARMACATMWTWWVCEWWWWWWWWWWCDGTMVRCECARVQT